MPIGDWFGVAVIGKIIFFGRLAWWIRRTAYLLFIPGILRRLRIVIDWTLHSFGFRYMIALEKNEVPELKP
jgi:NADH dehydrogenase FAD-containing subunit